MRVSDLLILLIMRVITLNFNPLDCSCWALSSEEYCVYCNLVCEATLEDYESGVGYWTEVGGNGKYSIFL